MSPDLYFALTLIVKMAVTAGFVVAATVTAERAGPVVGGLVATLPIGAGPVYVFLAMDHDPHFIAQSAIASLAINAANASLAIVYSLLAQKRSLTVSLCGAFAVWIVFALVIRSVDWTFLTAAVDERGCARTVHLGGKFAASCAHAGVSRALARLHVARGDGRNSRRHRRHLQLPARPGRQRTARGVSGGADQHRTGDASAHGRQGGGGRVWPTRRSASSASALPARCCISPPSGSAIPADWRWRC